MIDPHIAKALVEVSLFFEFSDGNIVDPDAAVSAMEQLAVNLQQSSAEARTSLAFEMRSLAGSYPDQIAFVSNLPEALGIDSE